MGHLMVSARNPRSAALDSRAVSDSLKAVSQSDHSLLTPVLRYSEEPDRIAKNPALRSTSEPASGLCDHYQTSALSRFRKSLTLLPYKPDVQRGRRMLIEQDILPIVTLGRNRNRKRLDRLPRQLHLIAAGARDG